MLRVRTACIQQQKSYSICVGGSSRSDNNILPICLVRGAMEPSRGGRHGWPGAGRSLALDHADTKSNMQDLQPLVLDMGTDQQASGSDLDKVLCQVVMYACPVLRETVLCCQYHAQ